MIQDLEKYEYVKYFRQKCDCWLCGAGWMILFRGSRYQCTSFIMSMIRETPKNLKQAVILNLGCTHLPFSMRRRIGR